MGTPNSASVSSRTGSATGPMARVYSALAPDLPVVDVDAPLPVRHWQGRALRDYYLIRRRAILDRMSP